MFGLGVCSAAAGFCERHQIMGFMAVREFISGSDFIFEIDRGDVAIRGELQFICTKGSISVALKTNASLPWPRTDRRMIN